MTFGEYLKRQRETKGWTQPEAASKAGIEQSYLSKLETGKSYPSEEMFGRLVDAFDIEIGSMAVSVGSSELSRLREIGEVRSFLAEDQQRSRRASRGWLIGALVLLMLGGASLGTSQMGQSTSAIERTYKSEGLLEVDEPIEAFDIIYRDPRPAHLDDAEAFNAKQIEMLGRIDEVTLTTSEFKGSGYFEVTDEGRRFFRLRGEITVEQVSPLRWFFVPALAFLFGSLGCFFISFRWR